jgi:hypothetical protein
MDTRDLDPNLYLPLFKALRAWWTGSARARPVEPAAPQQLACCGGHGIRVRIG